MIFFALENLTKQSVVPCEPWKWDRPLPSDEIRSSKIKRQEWHRNPNTAWNYYITVEGHNPNQRVSKENPPRLLHGFIPEFDLPVSDQRAHEVIADWKIKPSWIERSLGGNLRFVFLFSRPLVVDSIDFASYLLTEAVEWLALGLLPGLDEAAFRDPNRYYANGAHWTKTAHGPINDAALQTFFVEAGRNFRFTPPEGIEMPLDLVQKALVEKFPNFSWPGEFTLESSGPSFWVAQSQSTNSAILKPDGFFTFSAHADKPFYSWSDILGAEFVKDITEGAIAKATTDVWYDGKKFWRKKKGCYVAMEMAELVNFLRTDCGISPKGKQLDLALSHIYNENHVENAAPYLFRPPGMLIYMGKRRLNTASAQVMTPATGSQTWGPGGNFPFLSSLLDNLFTSPLQKENFLAWFQHFFNSGLNSQPAPGQAVFLMGGVCTGKTFTSREIVGRAVGGYVDASSWILGNSDFNSHFFEHALMVMDDDAISDSPAAATNVQLALKKAVANNSFLSNKKFQVAGMISWEGRIIATTNLDYISSRILGPLENSSRDKISVFRCAAVSKITFPSRSEMERLVSTELPFLLRWVVDLVPSEYILRDSRFGIKAHHEQSLMEQAGQTSKSAPFKELLMETLEDYFRDHKEATEWRGTVSRLIQQLHLNPLHESVIRTLRLEQVSRYLENVEKDGALPCRAETGPLNTRIWIFSRFDNS